MTTNSSPRRVTDPTYGRLSKALKAINTTHSNVDSIVAMYIMYTIVNTKPSKCLTHPKYCKFNANRDKILLALSEVLSAFNYFFWTASTRYNHLQLERVNIVIILASINFQLDVVWSRGVIFQLSIVWFRAGTSTINWIWILWAEKK